MTITSIPCVAVGNDRKRLDRLIQNAWVARHQSPPLYLVESFLGSVQVTLNDVLPKGEVEFFEFKGEDDYESILALSGGQLYTVRLEDEQIQVLFLGEFHGGSYSEEAKLDDGRIVETVMRYDHPRLPDGRLEYTFRLDEEEGYAPLRLKLREWAADTT